MAKAVSETYVLDFGAGKASKGVCAIRGSNQTGLSKVVLGLEVSHLGVVWSVDDTHRDREDGVALCNS
jgi:hypothetical protein